MIKPTLVLGASLKPHRYSHFAVQKLAKYNHEVYPVGLRSGEIDEIEVDTFKICLLYTSPSPRDGLLSRMPSSA